jgi:hypothetical protein
MLRCLAVFALVGSSLAFSPSLFKSPGLHGASTSRAQCKVGPRPLQGGVVGLRSVLDATRADHAPTAMKWEEMSSKPWGSIETDFMFVAKCDAGGEWDKGEILPYGDLKMSPRAGVINYGQGIFEGMKAQRTEDGRIVIFRC